jgi:uncharacterized MAPEG superfamily protein
LTLLIDWTKDVEAVMTVWNEYSMVVFATLVVGLLPLACTVIAKWGFRGYDNHNPRAWLANQEGFRARANAAQLNSHEAFPFFAVGVLLALWAGMDASMLARLCWFFIACRGAYIYCYVTDRATLRSLVWFLGLVSVVCLYVAAFLGVAA